MAWMAGTAIKRYRIAAGIDQRDLAEALQVSQAQMSRLESGIVPLSPEQLFFCADYFDAPELLLEYIQPFLDRAMDMTGASTVSPPERYLLALMDESLQELRAALDSGDKKKAVRMTVRQISLAQVVRVLLEC